MMADGLVRVASAMGPRETMDRLAMAIQDKGLTVFARIDHAANAAAVGLSLRPTEVVLFGNPKGGTLLMQDQQPAGIDLPLKALVWQDAEGKVWLSYNAPEWIPRAPGSVAPAPARSPLLHSQASRDPADPLTWGKVGRNEPCPCGSGKKYKHCHGRFA